MPDVPPQAPSRRLVILSSLSLACAVVLLFGLWPLQGGDLFMWLTVGRYTWHHGGPPLTDVFSYTSPGEEFIAHSWLAGLVFYLIEQNVGEIGFRVLRLSLIGTALGFALRTARMLGASWPAMIILAPFVLAILWARLEFRPHLFTTLFLALQLWLLISVHTGDRSWRWLWALPPIYALSINLHGGWIMGMAMLGAVGIALVLMEVRHAWAGVVSVDTNHIPSHLRLPHLALILAACGCALLINPYGSRLIWFPFQMQQDWIRMWVAEWASPWATTGWEAVGGGQVVSMAPVFWLYAVALVGAMMVSLRRWRTMDLVPLAVMAFWLAMSLRHLRAVADTVLLTSPFLAAALPLWRVKWPTVVGIGLTIALMTLSVPYTLRHGVWRSDDFPCLEDAIERYGRHRRVFSQPITHWVLFRLDGEVQVSSTWDFVAGQRRWAEVHRVLAGGPSGFHTHLMRYDVDVVILTTSLRWDGLRFVPGLMAHGWVVVHLTNSTAVLVPRRPDTEDLIAREGYHWLWRGEEPTTPDEAAALLAEANRALQHCPSDADVAWFYKAFALRFLGFHAEAEAADRHIAAAADARGVSLESLPPLFHRRTYAPGS